MSSARPLPIIGALLGHKQSATTERYAHLADDPLRAANEAIGQAISDMMQPGSAEVVDATTSGRKGSDAQERTREAK